MEQIDYNDVRKKRIVKRVKLLCDVLEIDHLGLVQDRIKRLQDLYNEYVVRDIKEIEPTEIELLKDQENHEILEAEIKAERKREGG